MTVSCKVSLDLLKEPAHYVEFPQTAFPVHWPKQGRQEHYFRQFSQSELAFIHQTIDHCGGTGTLGQHVPGTIHTIVSCNFQTVSQRLAVVVE